MNNNTYTAIPYYGKFLHSFKYMEKQPFVLQLPSLASACMQTDTAIQLKKFYLWLEYWLSDI